MAFGQELLAKPVHMLQDCGARRAGVESMSNGIPRDIDLVTSAFIVKMEKKLLCHARAYKRVSMLKRRMESRYSKMQLAYGST